MFKDGVTMQGTPDQKIRYIDEQVKKQIPKMLDSKHGEYSIHAYAETKVKQITSGTHDIATMRIELMNLYGDLIRMATHDSKYSQECREITKILDSIVVKLDDLRTREAQILQGRQPQVQTIPHMLPPMAPVIIAHKRSYWQRLKDAYKQLRSGSQTTTPVDTNPLSMQRLTSLLSEPTSTPVQDNVKSLPTPPQSTKTTTPTQSTSAPISLTEAPHMFNPLSLSGYGRPTPPPKLQRVPQTEFVNDTMKPIIDRLGTLDNECRDIKVDATMEGSVRFAQQKRKDALEIERSALIHVLVFLKNNPSMTQETSSTFATVVEKEYRMAQEGIQKVAVSQGVGDMQNPAYGMSGKTSELFNDMKRVLKHSPQQEHARRQIS
jgi:hypothetical protein